MAAVSMKARYFMSRIMHCHAILSFAVIRSTRHITWQLARFGSYISEATSSCGDPNLSDHCQLIAACPLQAAASGMLHH